MNAEIEMPHGLWVSPMDLTGLLSRRSAPMYPFRHDGRLYWLEALPEEGGRIALMRRESSGDRRCLTPPAFNIRTGVHEYGGCCFCLLGGEIVFNNFSDGRMYRQPLTGDSPPTAVTAPAGQTAGFADLTPLDKSGAIVAVTETTGDGGRDALVAVSLSGEAARRGEARPRVLAEGGDFCACPVVSPGQTEIAWLEWDNPFMPWDQCRLMWAEWCGDRLKIRHRRVLMDRADCAVCQPGFLDDGSLLFVMDGGGSEFWDFFHHKDGEIRRITDDRYEYGEPHWQFGQRRWQAFGAGKIIAVASDHHGDRLVEIALDSGRTTPLAQGFASCANLRVQPRSKAGDCELLLVARHADRDAEIQSLDASGGACRTLYASPPDAADHGVSRPQAIDYPTRDGRRACAYFYAPHNRRYRGPPGARPPLLVVVHGGPTGRATPEFHPIKQFFTSLGYAVLDINHRGSSGYGRAYRQCLLGEWGEMDAADIADGIDYVVARDLADPQLVFIRGGSAGGYAVLRMLTRFPRMFSGAACYYGIGNLITLAQITHRFEGCYTDRLIGETFDPDSADQPGGRFVQRSPVFQLERLACPLILFQGLDDKIVPPAVSREVAGLLAQKGINHEYIEYENEGHGFRQLPTRVDSLAKETAFFAAIIRTRRG